MPEDRTVIDLCRTLIYAFSEDTLSDSGINVSGFSAQLLGQVEVLGSEDPGLDIAIQGVGADHPFWAEQFKVYVLPYNGVRREIFLLHERFHIRYELPASEKLGLAMSSIFSRLP